MNQKFKKASYLLFVFAIVSCNKGYHHKYWIFPYHNDVKIDTSARPSFKIINADFAKDEKHVYYNEHLLTGVDPSSFAPLNKEIFKDKNAVYSVSTNTEFKTNSPKSWIIIIPLDLKIWTESKTILLKMDLANPKSFKLLEKAGVLTNYGTDDKHLFYGANFLSNISNNKPEFLSSPFVDLLLFGEKIFYEGEQIKEVDIESFQLFDHYAKDKESCFYFDYQSVRNFKCKASSFQPLRFPNPLDSKIEMDSGYAKDNENVYWEGTKILGANSKNFHLLNEKDRCVAEGYCGSDGIHLYESGVEK